VAVHGNPSLKSSLSPFLISEQGLPRQIAVVVVLIRMRGIGGELVPGVRHTPSCRSVPNGIVREALRRAEQRMRGGGQPIEVVIPKRLGASPVRETRAIPHTVIDVVCFVNLLAEGCQLMANRRDLRGRIIAEALCQLVTG